MTKKISRIAVIGAGISGLSATRELLRAGHEVVLIESSEHLGGLLDSSSSDGFLMEHAASSFIPAESGAAELARELGVSLEEALPQAKKRWVYRDGRLREMPPNLLAMLSGSFLSWRGKLRALAEPLQPTHPGANESVAEFFNRRLGEEVEQRMIAPFVTGVYAGDTNNLSLRACFPSLSTLEARGGLLRGLAATRVESAFSFFQDDSGTSKGQRILAPVGGLGALAKALARELEPHTWTSTSISSLEKHGREFVLHTASGEHHRFDGVVLATPAYVSASLVGPHRAEMAQALREIPYVPMVVVGLGYSDKPIHPLDGFGFVVAKGSSLRVLGTVFESSCFSGRAPEGGVMLRCMMGGSRDPGILDESNEAIVARAREDLKEVLDIRGAPTFQQVVRWPRAIPQYTIGHLDRVDRIEEGASSLGLVVTGNALGGISINDCVAKGKKVADRVMQLLNQAAPLALMVAVVTLVACGSSSQSPKDSGIVATVRKAPADAEVDSPMPDLPIGQGQLQVRARWLWPDSALRRSPGRNQCGLARKPAVEVELMGGLPNVAVTARHGEAPGDTRLSVSDCQIEPRVVVMGIGKTLSVVNMDERAHRLVVEEIDAGGKVIAQVGEMPMRIPGQVFQYTPKATALLRVHDSLDAQDFAYVVVHDGGAAVTDKRGYAEIELPEGTQTLSLWYPPAPGELEGKKAELVTTVVAKVLSKHIVDLHPPDEN